MPGCLTLKNVAAGSWFVMRMSRFELKHLSFEGPNKVFADLAKKTVNNDAACSQDTCLCTAPEQHKQSSSARPLLHFRPLFANSAIGG